MRGCLMRMLKRNRREIWYANPTGASHMETDEWGNETGEETEVFDEPVRALLNISSAVGQEAIEVFGSNTNYTRTIAAPVDCPIQERARIWYGRDMSEPHNYVVRKVADGLDSKLFALSEV